MYVLLQAADHLGPVEFARLGMMQALYPKGEPVYDTSRKDPNWGRRKLARDRRPTHELTISALRQAQLILAGYVERSPRDSEKGHPAVARGAGP